MGGRRYQLLEDVLDRVNQSQAIRPPQIQAPRIYKGRRAAGLTAHKSANQVEKPRKATTIATSKQAVALTTVRTGQLLPGCLSATGAFGGHHLYPK
jgi:hypothetical protein